MVPSPGSRVNQFFLQLRPVQGTALLLCSAVGALVLVAALVLTLVPVVFGLGLLGACLVIALLLGWVAIEAMPALERWLESDARFQ